MNYGYIPAKLESDHYILGAYNDLPKIILQPDMQWDKDLPKYEAQADNFETHGCTVYGTENAHEILHKHEYGVELNDSERFIYNIAKLTPPGADPHQIAEICREYSFLPQEELPMTDGYNEFVTPRPMEQKYIDRAKNALPYIFKHGWVFNNNPEKKARVTLMKEALQYSPLGVSVTAWYQSGDSYVDYGQPNNHWCVCYGFIEKDGETYWKIFDSYDHSHKLLHPDHHIECAKRYFLEKKELSTVKLNWFQRIIKWIKEIL